MVNRAPHTDDRTWSTLRGGSRTRSKGDPGVDSTYHKSLHDKTPRHISDSLQLITSQLGDAQNAAVDSCRHTIEKVLPHVDVARIKIRASSANSLLLSTSDTGLGAVLLSERSMLLSLIDADLVAAGYHPAVVTRLQIAVTPS